MNEVMKSPFKRNIRFDTHRLKFTGNILSVEKPENFNRWKRCWNRYKFCLSVRWHREPIIAWSVSSNNSCWIKLCLFIYLNCFEWFDFLRFVRKYLLLDQGLLQQFVLFEFQIYVWNNHSVNRIGENIKETVPYIFHNFNGENNLFLNYSYNYSYVHDTV